MYSQEKPDEGRKAPLSQEGQGYPCPQDPEHHEREATQLGKDQKANILQMSLLRFATLALTDLRRHSAATCLTLTIFKQAGVGEERSSEEDEETKHLLVKILINW